MHELALAQSILGLVEQYVPPAQAADVRSVRVRVGALSGVVPDSLDFCFAAIVNGTPWEAARLAIDRVPATAECQPCSATFEVADLDFACPNCGSREIRMVSGMELQVLEVELRDEATEVS
jgi:hydrogenase nickel incorporation protein HypA/HybF